MASNTVLMREQSAKGYINFLKQNKIPFHLSCSNYTIGIKSEDFNKKFVTTMQSNRTFAAWSKLKKDVKVKPIPDIRREDLVYYFHNFRENIFYSHVMNIDLKSAYAHVLFIDGIITEDTYKYLGKCNKQERLASVGMLASRKTVFEFKNGRPLNNATEIVDPLAPFFFHAVKKTYEIMANLKIICGEDYLFTWVDGIYFAPNPFVQANVQEYLDSIKFPYSFDLLTDFEVRKTDRHIKLWFKKDEKIKVFNLPHHLTKFKSVMADVIQTQGFKNKQLEKSVRELNRKHFSKHKTKNNEKKISKGIAA